MRKNCGSVAWFFHACKLTQRCVIIGKKNFVLLFLGNMWNRWIFGQGDWFTFKFRIPSIFNFLRPDYTGEKWRKCFSSSPLVKTSSFRILIGRSRIRNIFQEMSLEKIARVISPLTTVPYPLTIGISRGILTFLLLTLFL